jgi:hypothetical protein
LAHKSEFYFIKRTNVLIHLHSVEDLINLPERKGLLFCNEVKTDGFACRLSFARGKKSRATEENPDAEAREKVQLTLDDFTGTEIRSFFRPATIDPGRTSTYAAYYGNEQKRKLGTKEYYAHGGQGSRAKKMERKKKLKNLPGGRSISDIESNIPSCKSTSVSDYVTWTNYVLLNLKYLFDFYNFENTAEDRWQNFVRKQASIEESVKILINGGKKYAGNKRRKKPNKRRRREARKRKKAQSLAGPPAPSTPSLSQLNLDQAPQHHK